MRYAGNEAGTLSVAIRSAPAWAAWLAPAALLAGCASGPQTISYPPTTPAKPAAARPDVWRSARAMSEPGLEGVIGAQAATLLRQFGPARLDLWEDDVRKLQFKGSACVLDIYLYPPARGAEPEATYVDARRESDGQEVDRARCIAALRR